MFGITIEPIMIVAGGTTLLVLVLFQVLLGMRKIKFKGALHHKVHKWVAFGILAGAVFHGTVALLFLKSL